MTNENNSFCKKCKGMLAITSLKKNTEDDNFTVSILPNSKHLAFYNRKAFHLHCLNGECDDIIVKTANKIPEKSITDFSKLNNKKKFQLTCTICMENENVWLFMMPCTHILCNNCYIKWNKQSNKCPTCNVENYGLNKDFGFYLQQPKLLFQQTCGNEKSKKKKIVHLTLPTGNNYFKMPKLERQSSAPLTQSSLSTIVDVNDKDISEFDKLKMKALGENPNITISPVSTSKEIGNFSDLKVGTGAIFISAISEKLPTPDYNDLVAVIWQLNELNDNYEKIDFLNYSNLEGKFDMSHSGDNLTIRLGINVLEHGILIPNENKTEIHFVNKNIINKEINSVRDNLHLHKAFTDTFNELKQKLNDRKPKKIIACSQVTYNSNKTLKELSKNRTPSCGLIINEIVHSCDWTDDTNMTIWAFIFIY
jgi:hypothetical protein